MKSNISFILNDQIVTIDFTKEVSYNPNTTLLNYLRSNPEHRGVKEGCAEGDCGACTIVIAELNENSNDIIYKAVDSCLVLLPSIHGKQIITVENLAEDIDGKKKLHPVQQAMIDNYGSQCGFCTPGFIMSMFAIYKNFANPSKEEILDALTGNLCRCTGYEPIIKASEIACSCKKDDKFDLTKKEIIGLLKQIPNESIEIITDNFKYFIPNNLDEALILKNKFPNAQIINGSTDISLRITKKHDKIYEIIDLSHVKDINYFKEENSIIKIGSGTRLETIKQKIEKYVPEFSKILGVFGSKQIRSVATIGGNIGSASPIGDTIPILLCLDAKINIKSINGSRLVEIDKFIKGYRQTDLNQNELIESIEIPINLNFTYFKAYKISKRKDLDISTVSGAFGIKENNGIIEKARIAYGGMSAYTTRVIEAENYLIGKKLDKNVILEVLPLIKQKYSPISDARAEAETRSIASQNLMLKFYEDIKK